MSEDLFQMLLKLRGPDKASGGSELENMGKQAADKWLEGHADSLSDAVVQTVKSAGLTQEQVKRVIEFTNIEAYNREFKKESASKVIDFAGGPADPVFVLKDLNEGGGSMTTDHHSSDYDTPPGEKTASVDRSKWHPVDRAQDAANAEWEVQMHEHGDKKKADAAAAAAGRKHLPDYDHGFNYLGKHKPGSPEHAKQQAALKHKAPSEKTAHVNLRHEREFEQMFATTGGEYPEVNPLGDVMDLRDKLASQFDNMTSEIGSLEVEFQDLSQRLFGQVKQASMNGHSLSEIVHIWNGVAPDQVFVKTAMEGMFDRLLENGVLSGEELVASLQKVASHRVPNPDHPLVENFSAYCDVLSKLASTREMREEVGNAIGDLTSFLKAADVGGVLGAFGRGAGKALGAAETVGAGAGKILAGNTPEAALWGGRAGKAALVGGTALGANELYRRNLKYHPAWQAGTRTVREANPFTQDYRNKEYELAMNAQGGGFYQ